MYIHVVLTLLGLMVLRYREYLDADAFWNRTDRSKATLETDVCASKNRHMAPEELFHVSAPVGENRKAPTPTLPAYKRYIGA